MAWLFLSCRRKVKCEQQILFVCFHFDLFLGHICWLICESFWLASSLFAVRYSRSALFRLCNKLRSQSQSQSQFRDNDVSHLRLWLRLWQRLWHPLQHCLRLLSQLELQIGNEQMAEINFHLTAVVVVAVVVFVYAVACVVSDVVQAKWSNHSKQ